MFKKITKRTKEDKGNAVIILGIMLIMASLLVGGIILDISNAYQLKHSYINAARKATQSGMRYQNSQGYLTGKAAAETIRVYENIARPAIMNKKTNPDEQPWSFSYCNESGEQGRNVELQITFSDSEINASPLTYSVFSKSIAGKDTVEAIAQSLGIRSETVEAGKYRNIKLMVTEATRNAILPGISRATAIGGGVGISKCQNMEIAARARQFVGEEDGEFR